MESTFICRVYSGEELDSGTSVRAAVWIIRSMPSKSFGVMSTTDCHLYSMAFESIRCFILVDWSEDRTSCPITLSPLAMRAGMTFAAKNPAAPVHKMV